MNAGEIVERLERGENTFALEQDIGNHLNPLYASPSRVWPAYCNSVDAALLLVERFKPQWTVTLVQYADKWAAALDTTLLDRSGVKAYAPTPAAALVAALLRAGE